MTASNLGIIFGPTLIKPRQAEAEVSLSSLVDYPYQALMVELFISHQNMIFDVPLSLSSALTPPALSRHSRSLLDIKEVSLSTHLRLWRSEGAGWVRVDVCVCVFLQSSKAYKRHSSVIPSSHLQDEVKEVREVKAGDSRESRAGQYWFSNFKLYRNLSKKTIQPIALPFLPALT